MKLASMRAEWDAGEAPAGFPLFWLEAEIWDQTPQLLVSQQGLGTVQWTEALFMNLVGHGLNTREEICEGNTENKHPSGSYPSPTLLMELNSTEVGLHVIFPCSEEGWHNNQCLFFMEEMTLCSWCWNIHRAWLLPHQAGFQGRLHLREFHLWEELHSQHPGV